MSSLEQLPDRYQEFYKLDLKNNKKEALIVNSLGILIMIFMFLIGIMYVPFDLYLYEWVFMLIGSVFYIITHELIHGICMKFYKAKKVNYGFTGAYAYAGSDCYFFKKPYIVIALAPVVVWGIILFILMFLIDFSFFWIIYLIQIVNISGASGDFYVTYKFSKFPKDILVKDNGISMIVYSYEK